MEEIFIEIEVMFNELTWNHITRYSDGFINLIPLYAPITQKILNVLGQGDCASFLSSLGLGVCVCVQIKILSLTTISPFS